MGKIATGRFDLTSIPPKILSIWDAEFEKVYRNVQLVFAHTAMFLICGNYVRILSALYRSPLYRDDVSRRFRISSRRARNVDINNEMHHNRYSILSSN